MESVLNYIFKFVVLAKLYFTSCISLFFMSCSGASPGSVGDTALRPSDTSIVARLLEKKNKAGVKTIHVFVALCDNKYQGIVPVPAAIGNGQDPKNNLYWGAGYGVKTFFNKSSEWKLLQTDKNPAPNILERLLFRHKTKNIYLLADAYDGQFIKQTTIDFLLASSGKGISTVKTGEMELPFAGLSDIVAYIGHNGLMDFSLNNEFDEQRETNRQAIMLACKSKQYFSSHIKESGAEPLLWTTGLMAPEAYILHDALRVWCNDGTNEDLRIAAANAYSKYQRCSLKAAKNLLVSGW